MAAEPAAASKRPHLLLAQHVMGEVIEGLTETVSSEGPDAVAAESVSVPARARRGSRRIRECASGGE